MDTETRLKNLEKWKENLEKSNSIPRDIETAFRTRLGQSSFAGTSGIVNLSAGVATITDSRIKTTSSIVAISQNSWAVLTFNNTLAAVCNNGNAVIFEGSHNSTDPVNYIIIF